MIKSWSFSRYQTYQSCPYRLKLQVIDRVADTQPKAAADRGTAIHTLAEDFVQGKIGTLPQELKHYKDEMLSLKRYYDSGKVSIEGEWGFDSDWRPTPYNQAWVKVKADAVAFISPTHALVIDHKTGKRYGNEMKHAEQTQLYALSTLLRYPEIDQVTAELWYLDTDELASLVMKRRGAGKYLAYFDKIGKKITTETEFKPRANIASCAWCPYRADRQGNCEYGVIPNQGRR